MPGSSADDEEERRGGLPSAEEVSPRALVRFGLSLRLVADRVVLFQQKCQDGHQEV